MSRKNVADSVQIIGNEIERAESAYHTQRRKHQRIELKSYDSLCYLKTGAVSEYRLENNILTITIRAPAILGLVQMRSLMKSHYLRCDSDCEMWVIGTRDAEELFTRRGLWQHAFDSLTLYLQMYFERENMLSHPGARDIVIEHLHHIWSLSEAERKRISIYSFILARTHISRSSVHKIIQKLEATGEIISARGRLVDFRMKS